MNREFFKTAILNILVFLSLVLAFNIWFDKELWSSGYSSFVYSIENIFPFFSDDVYIENSALFRESEYGTQWITVSQNGKKSVIYYGDGEFQTYKNAIDSIKSSVTKSGTVSEVSDEDFTNVFKSNSVAVKFNTHISLQNYFDRSSDYFDGATPVSDLILFTVASDDSSIRYMYFSDKESGVSYRMPVKYENGNLISLISRSTSGASGSDSYAFELNFDKQTQGLNRILFESFVPITTRTKSIFATRVRPVSYTDQGSFDAVFKSFDIQKNSARSYKDTDNFINYIENYSTLKIREDGYFVFDTDVYSKGVHIGKGSAASDIIKFANSLYHDIVNTDTMLVLKDIQKTENGETVYGLIYSDGNTSVYLEDGYGVTVTVKEGYISRYSQKVLRLENTTEAFPTGSVIEAYDALYNSELPEVKANLTIRSLSPVNYYDGDKVSLKWYVEFSDGSFNFL